MAQCGIASRRSDVNGVVGGDITAVPGGTRIDEEMRGIDGINKFVDVQVTVGTYPIRNCSRNLSFYTPPSSLPRIEIAPN